MGSRRHRRPSTSSSGKGFAIEALWRRFDSRTCPWYISHSLHTTDITSQFSTGILPSGASYLLMNSDQMGIFARAFGLRTLREFWPSSMFASLSPIHFSTAEDLLKKLKTYNQKSNKGKKEDVYDNSQANRGYVKNAVNAATGSAHTSPGVSRSSFEHQR